MSRKFRVLLINPWIYDVAAFDLWAKPLGILYIAAILESAGVTVELLDCLDRYDPELLKYNGTKIPVAKNNGTGKYVREKLPQPSSVSIKDRQYFRYGQPKKLVINKLKRLEIPDIILMTSSMTYWYPAVFDLAAMCKNQFPKTPIILGGIYATLCPEHAQQIDQVDLICSGEGENQIFELIRKFYPDFPGRHNDNSLDSYPFPAYHLYQKIPAVPLLTSRGCPFRSGFQTIRLSFETASPEYNQKKDYKVDTHDLANAIDNFEYTGYPRKKIEVYILTGLPGQPLRDTYDDMLFVHGLGVKIRLAQFSPIPGTKDWQNSIRSGMKKNIDLLATNSSIFSKQWGEKYYQTQQKFHHLSRVLNYSVDLGITLSGKDALNKMV